MQQPSFVHFFEDLSNLVTLIAPDVLSTSMDCFEEMDPRRAKYTRNPQQRLAVEAETMPDIVALALESPVLPRPN